MDVSRHHYELQLFGLGDRFVEGVFKKIRYIQKHPLHYQVFEKQYRRAQTDIFPFLIVYEFEEETKTIIIISVFHTSRNPKGKFEKK